MTAAPAPADPDTHIGPQPGPQTVFLQTRADIGIAGGAAGGGKTHGLLLEARRHVHHPRYGGVIFRRTRPQITNEGGLWDASLELYPLAGAMPRIGRLEWVFPDDYNPGRWAGTVRFPHLQHDKTVYDYKSAELPFVGFDQLEDFSEFQFWYMQSRMRTTLPIKPYLRATCNPDPDSFLRTLLDWWISKETGYAIPERSGVLRWFVRQGGQLYWGDDPDELCDRLHLSRYVGLAGGRKARRAKSVTFVPSTIQDNPILQRKDPTYLATLESLPLVERERLLAGNWNIRASAGKMFHLSWWGWAPNRGVVLPYRPHGGRLVRFWDKAASDAAGADWTAGVLMGRYGERYVVLDVVRGQWTTNQRRAVMKLTAAMDARLDPDTEIGIEEEGGGGGKDSSVDDIQMLSGYPVFVERPTGSKVKRAMGYSARVEQGDVALVAGDWNQPYVAEHQAFPTEGVPDDQVDASSGAFRRLALYEEPALPPTTSMTSPPR
jgi:predicted phage terminase large subunit-like protein